MTKKIVVMNLSQIVLYMKAVYVPEKHFSATNTSDNNVEFIYFTINGTMSLLRKDSRNMLSYFLTNG